MGRPLITSFDSIITYPIVTKIVPYFRYIEPTIITIYCIFTKYITIYLLGNNATLLLFVFILLERILDCLDGEVARIYNKCSKFGHYLDKYSDVIYRIYMLYYCVKMCLMYYSCNIPYLILISLTIICPLCYIIDYQNGVLTSDLISNRNGYSIYVEDNATIVCFILPLIVYFFN